MKLSGTARFNTKQVILIVLCALIIENLATTAAKFYYRNDTTVHYVCTTLGLCNEQAWQASVQSPVRMKIELNEQERIILKEVRPDLAASGN